MWVMLDHYRGSKGLLLGKGEKGSINQQTLNIGRAWAALVWAWAAGSVRRLTNLTRGESDGKLVNVHFWSWKENENLILYAKPDWKSNSLDTSADLPLYYLFWDEHPWQPWLYARLPSLIHGVPIWSWHCFCMNATVPPVQEKSLELRNYGVRREKGKLWCFHIFNSYISRNELQLEGLICQIGIIKFFSCKSEKKKARNQNES